MTWQPTLPIPLTKIKEGPSIFLGNFATIEDWIETEHYGFADSLSGKHKPGECAIIAIMPSADRLALTNVPCSIAYDTEWTSFFYNDGSQWNNIGGAIETGTVMLFYQDTAPLGWTILGDLYDRVIYVTKGSVEGGETGGTYCSSGSWDLSYTVEASGHKLLLTQLPVHTHSYTLYQWYREGLAANTAIAYPVESQNTGNIGSNAAHEHTVSSNGTWRPATYSCILCEKV